MIFQAGASSRGQQFSGKHAEAVFISALRPDLTRVVTDRIRAAAEEQGRSRDDVKILAMLSVIVDETEERRQRQSTRDYKKYINLDSAQAIIGGWSGVDPSPVRRGRGSELRADRVDSVLLTPLHPAGEGQEVDPRPSLSTPPSAAWARSSLVTRFRLLTSLSAGSTRVAWTASTWLPRLPGSFEDFIEYVVPELQKRGRYRTEYEGNTLRENIFGKGHTKVADSHPAAKYRGIRGQAFGC